MKRLGLTEDQIVMDAEDIGGELKAKLVSFDEIVKEMEACNHLLFF
jgi:hypothetical protein